MAEECHCGREGVTTPKEEVVKRLEKQFPRVVLMLYVRAEILLLLGTNSSRAQLFIRTFL